MEIINPDILKADLGIKRIHTITSEAITIGAITVDIPKIVNEDMRLDLFI